MKFNYTIACSRYGASMGREGTPQTALRSVVSKLYLQRVPIDSGGYDPGGAYWGVAIGSTPPLYVAFDASEAVVVFWRARDRATAKRELARLAPKASFYR